MKRLILPLLCFFVLVSSSLAWMSLPFVSGGGGGGCAGTWCDDFNRSNEDLEVSADWGKEYNTAGTDNNQRIVIVGEEISRLSVEDTGYLLSVQTPTDKNYSVQMDMKAEADDIAFWIHGPIIRAKLGVGNAITGYFLRIRPSDGNINVRRYIDGTDTATPVTGTISNFDWSVYHTVRLTVSGGSADCSSGEDVTLTVYIDNMVSSEAAGTDGDADCINDTNYGGILSWWEEGADTFFDNYIFYD